MKMLKTQGANVEAHLLLVHYCRKWKFPFNQTTLDTREIEEFPELIINVIANQFLDTISKQPLTMYQPVEEVFQAPRGSINFKRYITMDYYSTIIK